MYTKSQIFAKRFMKIDARYQKWKIRAEGVLRWENSKNVFKYVVLAWGYFCIDRMEKCRADMRALRAEIEGVVVRRRSTHPL